MTEEMSRLFQDEIDAVDPRRRLSFLIDESYGEFQWSFEGLEVRGGTTLACEQGASELLEAMGFRWYAPNSKFWRRPPRIPVNLASTKQQFWMPANRIWLVYGHNWDDVHNQDRSLLTNAFNRWATLNAVHSSPYPAGHRWKSVIEKNLDFFVARPHFLRDISKKASRKVHTFDLEGLSEADREELSELCAAHLLKEGLNAFNRTHFDPVDSDPNSSDTVFPFTKAVADRVRSGTKPIGGLPSMKGVPDAQLGVYAYAGHRLPPTRSVAPSVYTQVALGFNRTKYSYLDLVKLHAEKAAAIMVREYLDTQAWSNGKPLINGRTKSNYFDRYDDFVKAGVVGANCEFGANWLVNLVMCRLCIKKLRSGRYSYQQALDDVMIDVFDEDPAVRRLYEFWSDPLEDFHKWSLRQSFDLVVSMRESWYKAYFLQLLTVLYEDFTLPGQLPPEQQDDSDPFPHSFSRLMSHVTALRSSDITHSFAWVRRKANGAVVENYPTLRYKASPRPQWWTKPTPPTLKDFNRSYTAILAATARDTDLDIEDLVVVQGITPTTPAGQQPTHFHIEGAAKFVFIGPGELIFTENSDERTVTTRAHENGLHRLAIKGDYFVSNRGGLLFLDGFPRVRLASLPGGKHWVYLPRRSVGKTQFEAEVRLRILHAGGRFDVMPQKNANLGGRESLASGQVAIATSSTREYFSLVAANRYISLHPTVALLPRVIVHEDFSEFTAVDVRYVAER